MCSCLHNKVVLRAGAFLWITVFFLTWNTAATQAQNRNGRKIAARHIEKMLLNDSLLKESSGLAFFNSQLWTINDGGNPPVVYAIDTSGGAVLRQVFISGASNIDWESICSDSHFVYIADVGNNAGNRQILNIYRVYLTAFEHDTANVYDTIRFFFEDYDTSTGYKGYKHPFDCEAITCMNDSIWVFTKNWKEHRAACYVLPKEAGIHVAREKFQLPFKGLVTGVTQVNDSCLVFIGYKRLQPRIWLWTLSNRSTAFKSGQSLGMQTEAIAVLNHNIYYSCEGNIFKKAALLRFALHRIWQQKNDLNGRNY